MEESKREERPLAPRGEAEVPGEKGRVTALERPLFFFAKGSFDVERVVPKGALVLLEALVFAGPEAPAPAADLVPEPEVEPVPELFSERRSKELEPCVVLG